jgi:uncharacterized repeat protein (TIGR03803 family)
LIEKERFGEDSTVQYLIHRKTLATAIVFFSIAHPTLGAYQCNILHTFDDTSFQPFSGLTADTFGNMFGTTNAGTTNGGEVYEIASGTNTFSVVTQLGTAPGAPANPEGPLLLNSAGDIFGSTYNGGNSNCGTVFEIAAGSHSLSWIASLDGTDGQTPMSIVADKNGNIFGTAGAGGNGYEPNTGVGDGSVFEVNGVTHAVSTVGLFTGSNGANPQSLVIDSTGDLFGTTSSGGLQGGGTVFEVPAGTGSIKTIASFPGQSNGSYSNPPTDIVLDSAGDIYGVTAGDFGYNEGGGDGSIFEIKAGTSQVQILHTFTGSDGAFPFALSLAADGNLYGSTDIGADESLGTVFEFNLSTNTFSSLFSFPAGPDIGAPDGAFPNGALLLDSNGDLFGTTQNEGPNDGGGTVFELSPVPVPEPSLLFSVCIALSGIMMRRVQRKPPTPD